MSIADPESLDCRWCPAWFDGPGRRERYAEHLRTDHAGEGSAQRDAADIESSGPRVDEQVVSGSGTSLAEAAAVLNAPPSPVVPEREAPTPSIPSPRGEETGVHQVSRMPGPAGQPPERADPAPASAARPPCRHPGAGGIRVAA